MTTVAAPIRPGPGGSHSAVARGVALGASPSRAEGVEIILDVSRLLSRVLRAAPTGIDRVEMAYAQWLLRVAPDRLRFSAFHPCGLYGRLPFEPTCAFLEKTARRWAGGERSVGGMSRWADRLGDLIQLLPGGPLRPSSRDPGKPRVYIQASPHHLVRRQALKRLLRAENAKFVCLVHDLIPIDFPEYARPGGDQLHRRCMDTVAALADATLTVSEATRLSLAEYLWAAERRPLVASAPLGTTPVVGRAEPAPEPYFVMLGTIEPRKNHLLVLNAFRQLVAELGEGRTPRLYVIGARGWENEGVIDMLERCPALKRVVVERNNLSDRQVQSLLRGARALLMPSFAEGFGLPVVESLQLGTPVVCSDIPALREVGRDAPDYLDPTDGPAWRKAIQDYANLASRRRADQVARLGAWRAPTWDVHVDVLLGLVEEVCR